MENRVKVEVVHEGKDGIYLSVRVQPNAKREEVMGVKNNHLEIRLTVSPVEGAANEALRKLIAEFCGVPKSQVTIFRGKKSRNKVVFVRGVSSENLKKKIDELN